MWQTQILTLLLLFVSSNGIQLLAPPFVNHSIYLQYKQIPILSSAVQTCLTIHLCETYEAKFTTYGRNLSILQPIGNVNVRFSYENFLNDCDRAKINPKLVVKCLGMGALIKFGCISDSLDSLVPGKCSKAVGITGQERPYRSIDAGFWQDAIIPVNVASSDLAIPRFIGKAARQVHSRTCIKVVLARKHHQNSIVYKEINYEHAPSSELCTGGTQFVRPDMAFHDAVEDVLEVSLSAFGRLPEYRRRDINQFVNFETCPNWVRPGISKPIADFSPDLLFDFASRNLGDTWCATPISDRLGNRDVGRDRKSLSSNDILNINRDYNCDRCNSFDFQSISSLDYPERKSFSFGIESAGIPLYPCRHYSDGLIHIGSWNGKNCFYKDELNNERASMEDTQIITFKNGVSSSSFSFIPRMISNHTSPKERAEIFSKAVLSGNALHKKKLVDTFLAFGVFPIYACEETISFAEDVVKVFGAVHSRGFGSAFYGCNSQLGKIYVITCELIEPQWKDYGIRQILDYSNTPFRKLEDFKIGTQLNIIGQPSKGAEVISILLKSSEDETVLSMKIDFENATTTFNDYQWYPKEVSRDYVVDDYFPFNDSAPFKVSFEARERVIIVSIDNLLFHVALQKNYNNYSVSEIEVTGHIHVAGSFLVSIDQLEK